MNLVLAKGVATNLYAATGITVGTQIRVHNQSQHMITLSDSQSGLARDATGDCYTLEYTQSYVNKPSSVGAWAKAETGDCLINVGVV